MTLHRMIGVLLVVVLTLGSLMLLRDWYVSAHCTMILGTRVCQ